MAQELSGIETLRTDFIANVSHELKTPLAVIQNYGTLLQQPDLPEEQRLAYAKAADRGRPAAGQPHHQHPEAEQAGKPADLPGRRQTYDLGEQLCECLLGFEQAWEEKGLDIDTDLEEDVPCEHGRGAAVPGLEQPVFQRGQIHRGGRQRISLSLRTEGAVAVVRVSDTGCGISPGGGAGTSLRSSIRGITSHAAQGNGLGLALVKRVVDIIGGDISVESTVGKGSSFTVRLRRDGDGIGGRSSCISCCFRGLP